MNPQARESVNDVLETLFPLGVTTLYFSEARSFKEAMDVFSGRDPFKNLSLDDAIITCLELNDEYYSVNSENKKVETRPNANRSVIDVWRHIKHYRPELTIFEVMDSVYHLIVDMEEISTFICGDIKRRVLILHERDHYCHDGYIHDVFPLTIDSWNNI